jgi:hypothetical protein
MPGPLSNPDSIAIFLWWDDLGFGHVALDTVEHIGFRAKVTLLEMLDLNQPRGYSINGDPLCY